MMEYWNDGPPWRDLNLLKCYYRNISEMKALEFNSSKSGLGQGTMGSGKMGHWFVAEIPLDREVNR